MARRSRAEGRSSGDADADAGGPDNAREPIAVRLDELLADRGMTLTELADQVGITIVNLSVLKNGRARAIRFTTLAGLCRALGCQPGDLLSYQPDGQAHGGSACGAKPG
jgi:putative transcriptional regulator